MQISVTGRHVEVTQDVKEYVEKKMSRLSRYYDRVQCIEVILDHESENFAAEGIVSAGGTKPIIAREVGPDTFALIDLLADKLERQLTRLKERSRNRKHLGRKTDKFEAT